MKFLADFESAARPQYACCTLAKRFKLPFGHRGSGLPSLVGGDSQSAAGARGADGHPFTRKKCSPSIVSM